MNTSYAEKWSRSYKEALKPLTEAQARTRHDTEGALYTVLIGDPKHPDLFIEIVSGDSIQVEFLDDQVRSRAAYQFVVQPDGRLFMVMASFVKFDSSGMQTWGRRSSFRPDGHATSFETDYVKSPKIETVSEHRIDIALNWEAYPEFGNYASIARYDRDKPPSNEQGG